MMEIDTVSETSADLNHLTRFSTREDFSFIYWTNVVMFKSKEKFCYLESKIA
jgi:hypothetical protein